MSSVGQIVGGIVGAVVGFFTPAGPIVGAQIGMMIGGAIDPPKGPVIRGPRLDDLSVQTATYGAFIPRVYGTVAIHGNVFWVQGDSLVEVKKVTESGGKGGPSQTTETFEYFATFAVGLCEGPIIGVRRIWIGNQIWYDAGSSDVSSIIASNENATSFTLYAGTETQLADPLIQADKGVANVPAHRGLAYIVFDMLALANYSNSLMGAQVKVEIVKDGAITHALTNTGSVLLGGGVDPSAVIVDAGYAYVVNQTENKLRVYDVNVPDDIHQMGSVNLDFVGVDVAVKARYAYVINYGSAKLQIFNVFVKNAPALVSSITTANNPVALYLDFPNLFCLSATNVMQIFDVRDPSTPILISTTATGTNPRKVRVSGNYAFVINAGSNTLQSFDITNLYAPSSLMTIATDTEPYGLTLHGDTAFVMHNVSITLKSYNIASPSAITLNSSVTMRAQSNNATVINDVLNVLATDGMIAAYDISTPALPVFLVETDFGTNAISISNDGVRSWFVDPLEDKMTSVLYSLNLNANQVSLGSIVQAECLKSKLLIASDIDVTELTDLVRGYRIGALGAIRAGLDPLRAAWPFDVVQSGYDIKFKKRGSASVATIAAGELDAHAAGDAPGVSITDMREMDLILPYKVGVKYLDTTREYDLNEQYAERLNTDAVNESAIDLPIVFTATEAAGKAETLLYLYWLERYDIMLTLPPSYAHLEPGDVITVEATFATYELRLTSTHHLPDGRVDCRAKYNSASIYTPAAQGAEGESVGATLTLAGPTVYVLLDIPLLRDADDVAGFPVAMTGYLAGWPGGVLFRSEDAGETWQDLVGFVSPGTVMGYARNTLSVHGGTVYDFTSELTVKLYQGTLASVSEAQLFAAQNWFAYGADGRWEIIAARTATLQGDGSYVLRDLLRGQLGTEWASGLHLLSDAVVRLNATDLEFVNVNASTIGSERNYRGITAGKALDTDSSRAFTYRGVNLECLSPVHATGSRHPTTNDWTLTWVRRTRFSGWRDYVDATLGETTESYEVDIFSDGTYATLKRTLTSATQTVAYTSANQVTDFGSNQATLYLKIYQLSATVGRGYPLTISITR